MTCWLAAADEAVVVVAAVGVAAAADFVGAAEAGACPDPLAAV